MILFIKRCVIMKKSFKLFIIFIVIFISSCTKSPKNVVLEFNEALIGRDYKKASKLCVVQDRDVIIRDSEEIFNWLDNIYSPQRDIEIKKVVRIEKKNRNVKYAFIRYTVVNEITGKIKLLEIGNSFKVVVLRDFGYLHYYYILRAW